MHKPELDSTFVRRFDRQIAIPSIDIEGQERLANSHIVIIGMGGLGNSAAQSLASLGIGRLTVFDGDRIELSNLPRQPLFRQEDIGSFKTAIAKRELPRYNPYLSVTGVTEHFCADTHMDMLLDTVDVVVDCTDEQEARLSIADACQHALVPSVTGAVIRNEGMLYVCQPSYGTPCYRCLQAAWPVPDESCTERGVFAPVVTLIGSYQALLAAQVILGSYTNSNHELLFFDAQLHSWQTFTVRHSKACSNDCQNRTGKR